MFKALEYVMDGILIATIAGDVTNGKQGQILSVAGRKGKTHFSYMTSVITVFMRNIGISPAGELLMDGIGEARDISNKKNLKEDVRTLVGRTFAKEKIAGPRISGFFLVVQVPDPAGAFMAHHARADWSSRVTGF